MKSRFKWNSVPVCSTRNSLQSIVIPLEWNGTNCVVPSCSTITMQGGTASGTQKKFRSTDKATDYISMVYWWNSLEHCSRGRPF
ncbi:MAG: hypothetical protein WCK32_09040 [Chlorobiaceae bacterium]